MASPPLDVVASLIAIRRRLACRNSAITRPGEHQPHVPPGTYPLVEQEHDLLGRSAGVGSSRWK